MCSMTTVPRILNGLSASTPIVVFAHIPLWTVYPEWGWGTDDSEQALSMLRRFGSVTVLNGHIHQIMQKVEGNIAFHTAMSTAFPQPAPGTAPSPGPMKVEPERLRRVLGITNVDDVPHVVVDAHAAFSSKVLDTNQTYTHRFTTPGTYDYFCSIHPTMTGRLIVS